MSTVGNDGGGSSGNGGSGSGRDPGSAAADGSNDDYDGSNTHNNTGDAAAGGGECSRHQPVYYGVININIDERTIGSVDVWRCGVCKKKFCEEKQLGIEEIADLVGMPKIDPDSRWAVTVCKLQKDKYKWKLVKLKQDGEIKHECLDERVIALRVRDFKVEDENHWSFLVDDNVNKAVEI